MRQELDHRFAAAALPLIAGLALVALLVPAPARAERDKVKQANTRYEKGLELYEAKDYPAAIVELKAAYDLDPTFEHLFTYAQAVRLSGDCETAISLYERLLERKAPTNLADAARELIGKCRESLEAAKPPPDTIEGPSRHGRSAPVDGDEASPPVWWHDLLGGALVGGGAVALGVGATFFVLSRSSADAAKDAETYPAYQDHIEKARTRRTISIVSLVAGGALVAGGVARYLTLPHEGPPRAALGFLWDGEAGGVVVVGRF